jgi:acyl-CoA dehydrogenase
MNANANALATNPAATMRDLDSRIDAAAAVAAEHARVVDCNARFPSEALGTIRAQKLLGILVPVDLGGEGASFSQTADVCYRLGQGCAATGMIYAMHQVKVACLARHGRASPAIEGLLRKVATEQLLLASSTTEGQAGANIRASEAPVIRSGEKFTLERRATCVSYGEDADGIVTTARRAPDAQASDQVLVAVLRKDYTLTHTHSWDTLGMRGTCSDGYLLKVSAHRDYIAPVPYAKIHSETMVPSAHLFWGAVWTGIAADAVARARGFIRHVARHTNGRLPPGAGNLAKTQEMLGSLRALLASGLAAYERSLEDEAALASVDFQSMITLRKVRISDLATAIVMNAMRACGLAGYRNDSEFSIGRHLRDILSSPIMIHNDRILASLGAPALIAGTPRSLRD